MGRCAILDFKSVPFSFLMFLEILFLVSCLIILYMVTCFIASSSILIVRYAHENNVYCIFYELLFCLFVCLFVFVALRPMSTAMVIAGRSVHLTTLFPGQA